MNLIHPHSDIVVDILLLLLHRLVPNCIRWKVSSQSLPHPQPHRPTTSIAITDKCNWISSIASYTNAPLCRCCPNQWWWGAFSNVDKGGSQLSNVALACFQHGHRSRERMTMPTRISKGPWRRARDWGVNNGNGQDTSFPSVQCLGLAFVLPRGRESRQAGPGMDCDPTKWTTAGAKCNSKRFLQLTHRTRHPPQLTRRNYKEGRKNRQTERLRSRTGIKLNGVDNRRVIWLKHYTDNEVFDWYFYWRDSFLLRAAGWP